MCVWEQRNDCCRILSPRDEKETMFFSVLLILTVTSNTSTLGNSVKTQREETPEQPGKGIFLPPTWIGGTPCYCAGNLILLAMTIISWTAPQITLIRAGMHQTKHRFRLRAPFSTNAWKSQSGLCANSQSVGFLELKRSEKLRSKQLEMFQKRLDCFCLALISESLRKGFHDCTRLTLPVICWTLTFRTSELSQVLLMMSV